MKKYNHVYQFKITLSDIKPTIWRKIIVPETYTFWDLHVAIQDSMGWLDCHLHEFKIYNQSTGFKDSIGIPDDEFDDNEIKAGWECQIKSYFTPENSNAEYIYDFGDNWEHILTLEKVFTKKDNTNYPFCISGKRKCPPEDCGGSWGYMNFLDVIKDPKHEEHIETLEWIGGEFSPEEFNPNLIHFDDPQKRWDNAFK